MIANLLIMASPLGGFLLICIPLGFLLDRDPAPRPVRAPALSAVPAPFPSSAIPDCPAIAGRVVDAAWMEFLSAHDLEGTP